MWPSEHESSYLAHHGILGQKWGVRRFQNEDGTRTEAGKVRYGANAESATIAKQGSSIASSTQRIVRAAGSAKRASEQEDVSNMSDDELRKKINRMNMEQQYRDLSTRNVSKGETYVNSILEAGGAALSVTASALTIAMMIKKLKE